MRQDNDISFCIRGIHYGQIKARFTTEELARKNATKTVETMEWILYPSFLGRRTVRVRMGGIYTEIESECVELIRI